MTESLKPGNVSGSPSLRAWSWLIDLGFLAIASLALRVVTQDLMGAGVSTDEYRYAVQAREWLHRIAEPAVLTMSDIVVLYPLMPMTEGLAALPLDNDTLVAGRMFHGLLNVLLTPSTYCLARIGGLDRSSALAAGFLMAVIPGSWEAAASLLPDNLTSLLSTLVTVFVLLAIRGRRWAWPLAGMAIGMGLLAKPHIPIVLAPALAFMLTCWAVTTRASTSAMGFALASLAIPVMCVTIMGAMGLGLPRGIFLSPTRDINSIASTDGLPGPQLEQLGARSSEAYARILRAPPTLAWFEDALGVRATSGAVTAFAIAGLVRLIVQTSSGRMERLMRVTSVALFGAVITIQVVTSSAVDAAIAGSLLATIVLMPGLAVRATARRSAWESPPNGPYPLLLGLALMCSSTIGFLSLNHPGVSVTTRQFQPILPPLTVIAGLGVAAVVQSIVCATRRVPFWIVATLISAGVAAAIPGSTIRRGVLLALSPVVGVAAQHFTRQRLALRTPCIAIGVVGIAVILGTPTLNTLARGRAFQGFPNDPYFSDVSGGVRVAAFRLATDWLTSNISPSDVVLTSKAYQVTYYANLPWPSFLSMRIWQEEASGRRPYLSDETLQTGRYDWIVEFNQFATRSDSSEAAAFVEDFQWLASRPYLGTSLTVWDERDRLLLYALRHQPDDGRSLTEIRLHTSTLKLNSGSNGTASVAK